MLVTERFDKDTTNNAHDKADKDAPNPPDFPGYDASKDFNYYYFKDANNY